MEKLPIEQLLVDRVRPELRGPLLKVDEVKDHLEWSDRGDATYCCDEKILVENFLGAPVYAECEVCGKWAANILGPEYGPGSVGLVDHDKYDTDTDATWIAFERPADALIAEAEDA
ncbi:MAG: hypothetical protein AAGB07_15635 [Pseudomonadota bacterium]